jgi:hypothetical protein
MVAGGRQAGAPATAAPAGHVFTAEGDTRPPGVAPGPPPLTRAPGRSRTALASVVFNPPIWPQVPLARGREVDP